MKIPKHFVPVLLLAVLCFGEAAAGEADVVDVEVGQSTPDVYHFNVTVSHDDTGWDHYADSWEIVAPDGTVLGTRTLLHPHVGEQPFTRSLNSVQIPKEISEVLVRAHDSVHGYGGAELKITLPR